MDYEKRYRDANDKVAARFGTNVAKEIFTDLYESEDEKIRKEIIEYLKDQQSSFISAPDCRDKYKEEENNKYNSWLAWLEKQGEKDSQEILPPFTFDDILALQCCMETAKKVQEDKDLYEKLKDLHGRVYEAYQLKKQSKQKETLCDKCKKEHPSHSCQDITVLGKCAVEHEQKPIEPKFKVGDKIYLKPEYRMPTDDTPIANTVKEIKEVDNELYKFDGAYIFIEDQDKYELFKQKPWNDEDEEALEMAIIALEDMYDDDTPNTTYGGHYMPFDKAANRLKSLKNRVQLKNNWKPSYEQMDALYTYIYNPQYFNSPDPRMELVISVYEDLKKLMEEE